MTIRRGFGGMVGSNSMIQTIPGTRALPIAQKGFREGYKAILRPAVEQIGAVLNRNAGLDGKIDPKRERQVLTAVAQIISRVFVGYDGRHAFAEDGTTPLSPFATLINTHVATITVQAVQNQRNWMRRHMPEDVFNWLKRAKRPDVVRETVSIETRMNPVFSPNVLAKYDPLHLWVDPSGYQLSDRIWRTDVDMRFRLDALIAEQIRNGNSAFNIAKKVEQFMLPGRAALRTNKPYGSDASYRGMVLGRTEITRAHGEATLISGQLNPYVTGTDWVLSGSHPKMDLCDQLATVDASGNRRKDPYPIGQFPAYPSHPQELCNLQNAVTKTPEQVTEELRAFMQAGDEPPLTPAADGALEETLLGESFYRWAQYNLKGVLAL